MRKQIGLEGEGSLGGPSLDSVLECFDSRFWGRPWSQKSYPEKIWTNTPMVLWSLPFGSRWNFTALIVSVTPRQKDRCSCPITQDEQNEYSNNCHSSQGCSLQLLIDRISIHETTVVSSHSVRQQGWVSLSHRGLVRATMEVVTKTNYSSNISIAHIWNPGLIENCVTVYECVLSWMNDQC
jgi:hypothetical protein